MRGILISFDSLSLCCANLCVCTFVYLKCHPGTNKAERDTNNASLNRYSSMNVIGHSSGPSIETLFTFNVCYHKTIVTKWEKNESCVILKIAHKSASQKWVHLPIHPFPLCISSFLSMFPFILSVSSSTNFSSAISFYLARSQALGTASSTVSVGGGLRSITALLMQCFSIQRVLWSWYGP